MKIKVSSFDCKKTLFGFSLRFDFFLLRSFFLLHRKKFIRRPRKAFESLAGQGSTHNQKVFGDLQRYLKEVTVVPKSRFFSGKFKDLSPSPPGSDHENFSKHVKSKAHSKSNFLRLLKPKELIYL